MRDVAGLGAGPLRAPLRRKKFFTPLRLPTTRTTFRPVAPVARRVSMTAPGPGSRLPAPAPMPGVLTARARQEAAVEQARVRRDLQVAALIEQTNRLVRMIDHLNQTGRDGQPIMRVGSSTQWIDGLQMKGEDPRVWRSPTGTIFRGNREHYMRLLLRNVISQTQVVRRLSQGLPRAPTPLSDVVQSESSPLVWFALALAASYLVFNVATT